MKAKLGLFTTFGAVGILLVLIGTQRSVNGQNLGARAEASAVAGATSISGMGTLSGTVKAPKEFKAAKVYAKNLDKHVNYMVYTVGGRYQAVDLFPGNYEVSVVKNGFTAEVEKVVVTAGTNVTADFTLQEAPITPNQGIRANRGGQATGVPMVSYDALYPPDPARASFEKTCRLCHGPDFLPGHQWDAGQWNAAIDLMSDPKAEIEERISPEMLNPKEREGLVAYFVKNFGPDNTIRGMAVPEMPVDEQVLGKAMYVEYTLPPLPNNHRRGLHDPHFDKDGNVWYTDQAGLHIGRLDPRTASFNDYPIPDPKAAPHGITMDGQGDMWFTSSVALGRIDSKTGEMTLYHFEGTDGHPGHGHTPVVDSKQNVWFTMSYANQLGRFDAKTKEISKFTFPTPYSYPYANVVDQKDNLWLAEWARCKIAKFDTSTDKFTEYLPLTQPCTLRRLSVDHKGMVWYALDGAGMIGRLDPNTGKMVEFTPPRDKSAYPLPYSYPYEIQPDRNDNIWISDSGQGGALVRFDQKTEKFTYYPSEQRTDMPKLEITRDGAIWFTTRVVPSNNQAVGVLYPDKTKIKTMAAYY